MKELESRCFKAIKAGNIEVVHECLTKGMDINMRNNDYMTPLMLACAENQDKIVTLLLQQPQIDINLKSKEQPIYFYTAILHAFANDENASHRKVIDMLFADKRLSLESRQHALLYYAKIDDVKKVKECLAVKACDVNYKHYLCDNALINAVIYNHPVMVKYLLTVSNVDVNCKNLYDETPLIIAIREGHIDIANLLLARADVDLYAKSSLSGTPLTAAIFHLGRSDIVEQLLAREPAFENNVHPGALLSAIRNDDSVLVKVLCNKGADVNTSGEEGYEDKFDLYSSEYASPFISAGLPAFDLPVIFALQRNKLNALRALLEFNPDLRKKGKFNQSARDLLVAKAAVSKEVAAIVAQYDLECVCKSVTSAASTTFFPPPKAVMNDAAAESSQRMAPSEKLPAEPLQFSASSEKVEKPAEEMMNIEVGEEAKKIEAVPKEKIEEQKLTTFEIQQKIIERQDQDIALLRRQLAELKQELQEVKMMFVSFTKSAPKEEVSIEPKPKNLIK